MTETDLKLLALGSTKDKTQKQLVIRLAVNNDMHHIIHLIESHSDKLFDDYTFYSREYIYNLIHSKQLYAIDHKGVAVGLLWYSELFDDLHIKLHFILQPVFIRMALKSGLFKEILDTTFNKIRVKKIKASIFSTQKTAFKLLKRFLFKHVAVLKNETRLQGEKVDLYLLELQKYYWQKNSLQLK